MTSSYFNAMTGAELFFKCENFQKAGAFKARGAVNAVFGLSDKQAANGVATHSSGNHGQALSYAAGRRGIKATVVMPDNAPLPKKSAVRGYGGDVLECTPTNAAREQALEAFVSQSGAEFIHPYNDARVIAGQATCALELIEDAGPLDAIVAPIGGGGLVAGTCLTATNCAPDTLIFAAEPSNADDAWQSLHAGRIIEHDAPDTIADGLKTNLGTLTWHFVSRYVNDILLASEAEIVDAMFLTWERMKIIIEPSCAVPLAVITKNSNLFSGKKIGVILTGGNVDLHKLPWLSA
ncbi:MAG: pyridoxal-phosphate dependent enzyme [Gammaproteobacteria bacterium]